MLKPMMIVLVCLSLLYLAYVIAEHYYYQGKRKKIPLVIHVNGIRGKSTVTRLIGAGLRNCGYKVFSKTTGTIPMTIETDGAEKKVRRWGPANIREQMRVLDQAAKQHADALVVECMAVNPELQYLCEHRILRSDVTVITNVRPDHLDVMGDSLEAIAYSLANTVPDCGKVVLGEENFKEVFEKCAEKVKSEVYVADSYYGDNMDTFPENVAVALKVCEVLQLDVDKFYQGMKNYLRDPGALAAYKVGDTIFINGFSVNDPESIEKVYAKVLEKFRAEDVTVLLNTRPDRPFRVNQHLEMLQKMKFGKLVLTGSNLGYVSEKLSEAGIKTSKIKSPEELLSEKIVFGCGNIAHSGMAILDYFKKNGETLQ